MPLVLPLFLEGVSVDPMKIARSLVLLMMLPLAIGLLVKARLNGLAAKVQPSLGRVSILSLALLIAPAVDYQLAEVLNLYGTRGVLASILFIAAGSGIADITLSLISGYMRHARISLRFAKGRVLPVIARIHVSGSLLMEAGERV